MIWRIICYICLAVAIIEHYNIVRERAEADLQQTIWTEPEGITLVKTTIFTEPPDKVITVQQFTGVGPGCEDSWLNDSRITLTLGTK